MAGDVLKKFGRYFLLDQMAQGGMAEIYRARLAGVDGSGRLLVIKRIQAGYGGDREFLQMFKSEIKVTMGLNHPNIVQLYDFGEENNQPFIAMEFVDGKNLRQFMSRFNELKQPVPIELAVHVIEQAASGLHYAHNFKDKLTGQPLMIVHRDISPQNILISYEGNVKVIDFGIAKATTNVESTRQNVIKGKPSYLSPEQISGETLDGRSDIFSLGTVLWEILAGKKLFSGDNDRAVLMQIESCSTFVKPPSTLNSRVPKELDYIVLKSLAKNTDKRFQTAEEFQRALHKFLYNYMPDFNPSDLGYIAKDLFSDDIVEDRKKIQRLNEDAEKLLSGKGFESANKHSGVSVFSDSQHHDDTTTVAGVSSRASAANDLPAAHAQRAAPVGVESVEAAARRKSALAGFPSGSGSSKNKGLASVSLNGSNRNLPANRMRGRFGGAGAALWISLIAGTGVVYAPELGFRIPVVSDLLEGILSNGQAQVTLDGRDRNVAVQVNGKNEATSLPVTLKVAAGKKLHVVVTGSAGKFEQVLVLKPRERKTVAVALSQEMAGNTNTTTGPGNRTPAGEIPLRLSMVPPGGSAAISINGKAMDKDNPVLNVPMDTPLELVVERDGFRRLKREFFVESKQASGLREFLMEVQLEPVRYGYVTIHTTPSASAIINIDGKEWIKSTPFEHEKIPAGTYTIRLVNETIGMEKTVVTTIQDGKNITIDEQLKFKD